MHQSHPRRRILEGRAGAGNRAPSSISEGFKAETVEEEQPSGDPELLSFPILLSWILRQQHLSARSRESTAHSQL